MPRRQRCRWIGGYPDHWSFSPDDSPETTDCVVLSLDELETIDRYKADFESAVSEQEGLWIKNGGPTDEEWEAYKAMLNSNCGMDELLAVYQAAYDRYAAAED